MGERIAWELVLIKYMHFRLTNGWAPSLIEKRTFAFILLVFIFFPQAQSYIAQVWFEPVV